MSRIGHVLIVDDRRQWRNLLSRLLDKSKFNIRTAATIEEAMELLKNNFFHLVVLDIGFEYEGDKVKEDGMEMLKQIRAVDPNLAIRVLLVSAHRSADNTTLAFRDLGADDSMDKSEFKNYQVFTQKVENLFSSERTAKSPINLDLSINWPIGKGPKDFVTNMEIDGGQRVQRDTPEQDRYAYELEDLICRLFYDVSEVWVSQLSEGASGSKVLQIQPLKEDSAMNRVILKFGDYHRIDTERRNFEEFASPYLGDQRSTMIKKVGFTPKLGGIVYTLVGSSRAKVEDFATFYQRADENEIEEVLGFLFKDTCAKWYEETVKHPRLDLAEEYRSYLGFNEEKLQQSMERLQKYVQGKEKLTFKDLDGQTFTNPVFAYPRVDFRRHTYSCITHGDLNAQNILIDRNKQTWLIDFFRTGFGHIFRDVAQLDTVVRFQLLNSTEIGLHDRCMMEERLNSENYFADLNQVKERFISEKPALMKAFNTTVFLRKLAGTLIPRSVDDDMTEYYMALLFYSLNFIRFSSAADAVQRQHALLSASMIIDHLRR